MADEHASLGFGTIAGRPDGHCLVHASSYWIIGVYGNMRFSRPGHAQFYQRVLGIVVGEEVWQSRLHSGCRCFLGDFSGGEDAYKRFDVGIGSPWLTAEHRVLDFAVLSPAAWTCLERRVFLNV